MTTQFSNVKFKKFDSGTDYIKFSQLQTGFQRESKVLLRTHLFKTQDHLRTNPREFWILVREQREASPISSTVNPDETRSGQPIMKCLRCLLIIFFSVYKHPDN